MSFHVENAKPGTAARQGYSAGSAAANVPRSSNRRALRHDAQSQRSNFGNLTIQVYDLSCTVRIVSRLQEASIERLKPLHSDTDAVNPIA